MRRGLLVALLVFSTLFWVGAAAAADDSALLDQYSEDVPSAGGTQSGGGGGGSGNGPRLTDQTRDQLVQAVGQEDASLLEQVATSSTFGAPQKRLKTAKSHGDKGEGSVPGFASPEGDPFSDAVSAVTDGSRNDVPALAVLLGIVAASGLAAAAYRRKRTAA